MFYNIDELSLSIISFFAVTFGFYFHQCIVWTFSPFIVKVLLTYFKKETMKKNEDLVQKSIKCVHLFERLTLCFANFFVLYFTLNQFYSIFMVFGFVRSVAFFQSFSLKEVLALIGFGTGISYNIFWLITLTHSVDDSNECIQALGREIQEKLLVTEETQDRRYLKFLRQRVNDLKPMNASGYFTIDRTTLTSMLSVR